MMRKSVAAVRALGRRGLRVIAAEATVAAPGMLSRFAWRRLVHRPGDIDALVRARARVLFAMEEETLLRALERRAEFEAAGCRVPYAPAETIRRFSDKLWTTERARALGIPVPRSACAPPAVVKPRRGSGARGLRYVDAGPLGATEDDIVQERIPPGGESIGISLLYDEEGGLRAVFAHRRLREYPATGGPSTLRESIAPPPNLVAKSRALLESERFVGPAMVEWKAGLLLEVNPRFWGSLALAIRAGVDFPWLLYRLARGERFAPVTEYRTGVRVRWLLPGDILHFLQRRDWWGLLRNLGRWVPDDVLDGADLSGVMGTCAAGVQFVLRPEFRRFLR